MKPETIVLALGSNVGDRKKNILDAIEMLKKKISSIDTAPIYETKPVGYTDQADFLNTAIKGETLLSPGELLSYVKEIEKKVGRVDRFRWGPREIDIDIIFYGDRIHDGEGLTIPHPMMHERDFVLRPISDLDADFKHPILGKTIREMLADLLESSEHSREGMSRKLKLNGRK